MKSPIRRKPEADGIPSDRRLTSRFTEIAENRFVGRYAEWSVSVGAVVGAAGALVVDTRASAQQGATLRDDVRRLAPHASPVT